MFNPSIIFQRTHAGREEIKHKSHGLTQSERLVLIMIDGVASYQGVRNKLPALTDVRFERALKKLHEKELLVEIFMPVEGQDADEIESAVIDRFLQQDPLDPVTIMLMDPDELEEMALRSPAPALVVQSPAPALSAESFAKAEVAAPAPAISVPTPAMDEDHNQMADSLGKEVRARQTEKAPRIERVTQPHLESPPARMAESAKAPPRKTINFPRIHWGYWMIGLGTTFIAGFSLARMLA